MIKYRYYNQTYDAPDDMPLDDVIRTINQNMRRQVMPDHSGFILAAYGFAVLVTLAMIVMVIADYRRQKRALARFETDKIP